MYNKFSFFISNQVESCSIGGIEMPRNLILVAVIVVAHRATGTEEKGNRIYDFLYLSKFRRYWKFGHMPASTAKWLALKKEEK